MIKYKKYTFSVFIYLKREGGGRKKERKAKGRKVGKGIWMEKENEWEKVMCMGKESRKMKGEGKGNMRVKENLRAQKRYENRKRRKAKGKEKESKT